jgi:dsRNA-specific ribonuclease
MDIQLVSQLIGYSFKNTVLLRNAFIYKEKKDITHEYFKTKTISKQELSFTGDSLLYSYITLFLIENFHGSIREMHDIRRIVISNDFLYYVFHSSDICSIKDMVDPMPTNLQDKKLYGNYVEALIAAIYFDGGNEYAYQFSKDYIFPRVVAISKIKSKPLFRKTLSMFVDEFAKVKVSV